ncbi:carbon-nitrogen hydrolase [Colletotrichum higginsianum]|nr:carbon-nitrogen hydrolase [Colletotrichum higginsianum]
MTSNRPIVKVAAVQAAPVSFDLDKSLQKLSKLTEEAAAAGADLVVFPTLQLVVEWVLKKLILVGRKWFAKYFDSAVEVPSPAFDRLSETARANNILLQVGIIEKAGGTLYCTALLLDREGKVVYKHRKVMPPTLPVVRARTDNQKLIPTAAERLVWGRGSGDGLQVLQTDVGKVGSLIWSVVPNHRRAAQQS